MRKLSQEQKAARKAYKAQWYRANSERLAAADKIRRELKADEIKAQKAAYRARTKEQKRAIDAAYYKANTEKIKAATNQYYVENKEQMGAAAKRRYAEKKESIRAANDAWAKANTEKMRAYRAAWFVRNKESVCERATAYRAANPEKVRCWTRKWRQENPGKSNAITARRRAQKLQATPAWAEDFLIEEAYHLAALRTRVMGFEWHVDHIVPLQSKIVCGLHAHTNLQVIPGKENTVKHNRYWPDMP